MTSLMSDADLAELNGEIIESTTTEIAVLPPDVDTKVSALKSLDGEAQARSVTVMLSHSRTGLLAAIAAQDLPGIVEYKAKASAIHEITKQLKLGKDMQLDAAEFIRRAERGLGVAIREGQANGTVAKKSESTGPQSDYVRGGKVVHVDPLPDKKKKSPAEYIGNSGQTQHEIYALTDNVSDDQFEEALTEAKEEGNLSRANVARKAKAKAKPALDDVISEDQVKDLADAAKKPPAPRPAGGPKGDPNEMLGNIDGMLRGIVGTLQFIRPEDINDSDRKRLVEGIFQSINQIRKSVKEIANG